MYRHTLLIVTFFLATLTITLLSTSLSAADWTSWRGPNWNAVSSEKMIDVNKSSTKWQKEIGLGYTAMVTKDGRGYIMGHDGGSEGKGQETLYCLDLKDGKTIWSHTYKGELIPAMHAGGPNATPLLTDKFIYTVSKDGKVHCRELSEGGLVWAQNLTKVLEVKLPNWGFASSPQIFKGQLILSTGRTAAFDPMSGKVLWVSDRKEKDAYATPIPFTVKGKDYAVIMTAEGANIISLQGGKTLATYKMKALYSMIASTPVLLPGEGELLVTTSNLSARLYFDGEKLTTRWTTRDLTSGFANAIYMDGHVYGVHGRHGSKRTSLVAIDIQTGRKTWEKANTGFGSLAAGKNGLMFLSEDGELISYASNPAKFQELGRRKVLERVCWTAPVLSSGVLYVRNDQGKLLALSE